MNGAMRFSAGVILTGLFVCCQAGFASGQGIALKGIEAGVGYLDPEDPIGSTFLLEATADLGEIVPALHLEGTVDYWGKSYDVGSYESSFRNIGFIGALRYAFPLESSISPFVFAGLGLHVARVSAEYPNPYTGGKSDDTDTNMEFGVRFGGGLEYPLSTGVGFVARAGFDSNGGADYFFVTGGLRFQLGD